MSPLKVLLGVSGGIAAYKAAELVRRLRSRGHEVRCALTRGAVSFVAPLTLEVLSGHRVYQEEYLAATGSGEEAHITVAAWAEVLCVAPATTHVLARLALGLGDDFLTTTALAFAGPVVVAPAMHPVMWGQEATRQHAETLKRRGVRFAGPVEGPLASGEVGMGRMAEPEEIVKAIEAAGGGGPLAGHTVLVSAGPTFEPVDPVRFLGNRSSGRMGFALAAEAARRGARTILVAGPVALPTPAGVTRVDVVTAREMERAVHEHAPAADVIVMAAAVADYRPRHPADRKIKKEQGLAAIELEENPDILAGLRAVAPEALLVGFAAETHDLERNARAKLERKGADLLIANDVSRSDIAFGSGDNEVTVYRREGEPVFLSRRPKGELAASLFDLFAATLSSREQSAPRPV
ncbi:MAG TPA: bifunctional phosphopantothenoylcysteine decarboxylase/phosphopantothenate--cysteine ligase CoaBC [Thermoanaerobaculia bacterium]|jgi:phosphopantothenoylcysteine decarboxylase/phosphopantothenate--cysteine ligase|nr:bifunctional phosphopantothenoylcysteine decarboxylase/phosphopantothenate--cysteine ligase CoaBC [Thermoanaerobaculia bacterium]